MIDKTTLSIRTDGVKTEVYLNNTLIEGVISVKYESNQDSIPVLTLQMYAPIDKSAIINKKFNVEEKDFPGPKKVDKIREAVDSVLCKHWFERLVNHPQAAFGITVYSGPDLEDAVRMHEFVKLLASKGGTIFATSFVPVRIFDADMERIMKDGVVDKYIIRIMCVLVLEENKNGS